MASNVEGPPDISPTTKVNGVVAEFERAFIETCSVLKGMLLSNAGRMAYSSA